MKKKPTKYWEMIKQQNDESAKIYISGDIVTDRWFEDETSASSFKKDLDELGDVSDIELHINSGGGSVFDGIAIFNMLKAHKSKITVHVDALAASIASVIAMAGDKIIMPNNSMLMIHNPWTFTQGNAKQLRKQADDLDQIGKASRQSYLAKAGDSLTESKLIELLDAETWLTAEEAVDYGLADEVEEPSQVAASIDSEFMQRYKNVPKQLVTKTSNKQQEAELLERQEIIERSRNSRKSVEAFLNTKIFEN